MPSTPSPSLEYSQQAFAFVDILGFAQLVERSAQDDIARTLVARLLDTDHVFTEFMDFASVGRANFFSDSIVVSMASPEHYMLYMVREIGMLARYLLFQGFASRGGITAGPVFHEGKAVVGPALVAAYRLEQRAIYPRIILDAAALEYWRAEFRPDSPHPQIEGWVKRDKDGEWFIDIFGPLWKHVLPMAQVFDRAHDVPTDPDAFKAAVMPHIQRGCADSDPRIRAKWEWLCSECEGG